MTSIRKELTDQDIAPIAQWGGKFFQPTLAILFSQGIASTYAEPNWGVKLTGPILTKTGKHHKTHTHSRTYGPLRYRDGLALPDGRSPLALFTEEEVEDFGERLAQDARRFMDDTAFVVKKVMDAWGDHEPSEPTGIQKTIEEEK